MHAQQINLLKTMALGEQDGSSTQGHWIEWGLAVLILLSGLGVYNKGAAIVSLHNEIASQRQKKVFLTEAMGAAEAATKEVAQVLALTLSERVHWSKLLREVSFVIPEGVWITQWESIPARPQPQANQAKPDPKKNGPLVKISGEARSQEKLTRFLLTLDRSPLLLGSRLAHARQINGEVQFEVVVTLKAEQAP